MSCRGFASTGRRGGRVLDLVLQLLDELQLEELLLLEGHECGLEQRQVLDAR